MPPPSSTPPASTSVRGWTYLSSQPETIAIAAAVDMSAVYESATSALPHPCAAAIGLRYTLHV